MDACFDYLFKDPDGNQLEFISLPEEEGKPELRVVSYEEWLETGKRMITVTS